MILFVFQYHFIMHTIKKIIFRLLHIFIKCIVNTTFERQEMKKY